MWPQTNDVLMIDILEVRSEQDDLFIRITRLGHKMIYILSYGSQNKYNCTTDTKKPLGNKEDF